MIPNPHDIPITAKSDWWTLTKNAGIVTRSLKVAAVVGTILVLINYGDHLGSLTDRDLFKIFLTYLVPYCVSTYACVRTAMEYA